MYIIHGNIPHCFWKVQIIKNEFLKNVVLYFTWLVWEWPSIWLLILTLLFGLDKNIVWLLILRKILFDFSVLANAECKIKWYVLDFLLIYEWQLWNALEISFIYIWEEILHNRWMGCLSVSPQNSVLNICMKSSRALTTWLWTCVSGALVKDAQGLLAPSFPFSCFPCDHLSPAKVFFFLQVLKYTTWSQSKFLLLKGL